MTRTARPTVTDDRYADKRAELAAAALQTLSRLGFARTTLRDIAQNSPYSHGVVHYYFSDKAELITECVKHYKADCIERHEQVTAEANDVAELRRNFPRALSTTMVEDGAMHRLWYDLRAQCMFEQDFAEDVAVIDKSLERMIWRMLRRYSELSGRPITVTSAYAYSLFDGLFQHALSKHLAGRTKAASELRQQVRVALDQLFPA